MSKKREEGNLLDTKSDMSSGSRMIYGLEIDNEIRKKYKENELTESEKLIRRQRRR